MNHEQQFGYDFQNFVGNYLELEEKCFVIRKGQKPDLISKIGNHWVWIECKTKNPESFPQFDATNLKWSGGFLPTSIKYQIVKEVALMKKKYRNNIFVLLFSNSVKISPSSLVWQEIKWKFGSTSIFVTNLREFQNKIVPFLKGRTRSFSE